MILAKTFTGACVAAVALCTSVPAMAGKVVGADA